MPRVPAQPGQSSCSILAKTLLALLWTLLLARPIHAQSIPAGTTTPGIAIVTGSVHDSISGWPLRDALVQLVAADEPSQFARSVISDSAGRYSFADVPNGKYTLGFFHPMLDSLGLPPIARAITIADARAVSEHLFIPGARRMREAACGAKVAQGGGGVVIGMVRDAQSRAPLTDARVVGTWHELQFSAGKVVQRAPSRDANTEENGWFALCDVPGTGVMSVMVSRGADSTDLIELEVPADGFLRREFFLGTARVVARTDISDARDTLMLRSKEMHLGEGRLTGTVIALDGGKPIAGAVVGVTNGPQTRANERGQWTLTNVPPGSRTLEVRAVGHYPVRRAVDMVDNVTPIRVAMTTFKAVLDTLKVTAGLSVNLDLAEFNGRRKSGLGRFLSAEDIYKRNPLETTDLFRNFPTLEVARVTASDGAGTEQILMKGVFEGQCTPNIVINGTSLSPPVALGGGSSSKPITTDVINNFVRPERIIGVEVYSPTNTPPQFQSGLSGCGAIVIWARR